MRNRITLVLHKLIEMMQDGRWCLVYMSTTETEFVGKIDGKTLLVLWKPPHLHVSFNSMNENKQDINFLIIWFPKWGVIDWTSSLDTMHDMVR